MVRFLGFILTRIRNGATGEPGRMVVFTNGANQAEAGKSSTMEKGYGEA